MRKTLGLFVVAFAMLSADLLAANGFNNYDCWNGGANALANTTTGNLNVACGTESLQRVTTGNFNVGIGARSGNTTTTGSSNDFFGYNITAPAATTSNWLSISDVIVGSKSAPAASSCGTSPTLATGTSDIRGTVTTGSGATACTLTFATAKANAPACIVTARSGTPPVYTTSTAALTLSTAAASATYDYFCSGK